MILGVEVVGGLSNAVAAMRRRIRELVMGIGRLLGVLGVVVLRLAFTH